ncbi:hypothetical protein, partial [Acinetobacter indicus]|uniref:hypothetical protein n=1 Tax=Acinetobacter indicus TaxID=756892 RepID=UPI0014441810
KNMTSSSAFLMTLLALLLVAGSVVARQDPKDYWERATGNQAMPEAIEGLVHLEGGKGVHYVKVFTSEDWDSPAQRYRIIYGKEGHHGNTEPQGEKPFVSNSEAEPGH